MNDEDLDTEMLRAGLNERPLAGNAMARIRRATEQEWKSQLMPARDRRHWSRRVAVAAVVLLSLGAVWTATTYRGIDVQASALGRLERVGMQGVFERRWPARVVPVSAGDLLRVGQSLDAQSGALIALANGGTLRLAKGTRLEVVSDSRIRLTRGMAYVDIPPGVGNSAQFVVQTPYGDIAHVGTQFEVALLDDQTQVRVREGQVAVRVPGGQVAVAEAGSELRVAVGGTITRNLIPTAGHEWAWVEALAPEFDIENRLLGDYLQWVSRETGRKLVMDDGARKLSMTIRLHGSVRGLAVLDSYAAVMATTTLHYDTPVGLIRVSSGREEPAAELAK